MIEKITIEDGQELHFVIFEVPQKVWEECNINFNKNRHKISQDEIICKYDAVNKRYVYMFSSELTNEIEHSKQIN